MQAVAAGSVVALLNDLMFQVKIDGAAKQAGVPVIFVKSQVEVLTLAQQVPRLIVLDLNYSAAEPLKLISLLKAGEQTRTIPLLGYVSHVQTELRREAAELGCDSVVPRSTFADALPRFLNLL